MRTHQRVFGNTLKSDCNNIVSHVDTVDEIIGGVPVVLLHGPAVLLSLFFCIDTFRVKCKHVSKGATILKRVPALCAQWHTGRLWAVGPFVNDREGQWSGP